TTGEVRADGNGRSNEICVVQVINRKRRGNGGGRVILGISQRCSLNASQHGGIIHSGDGDGSRGDITEVIAGRAVVDLEGDGADRGRGIVAGVLVLHGAESCLVVGQGGGAAESQHAGIEIAGDAELVGKAQHIFTAGEVRTNGNGCPGEVDIIRIV